MWLNLTITTLVIAFAGEGSIAADKGSRDNLLASQIRSDILASIKKTQEAKSQLDLELSGASPAQVFENIAAFRSSDAWKALCDALGELSVKNLAYFDRQIRSRTYAEQLKCAFSLDARLDGYWQQSRVLLNQHVGHKDPPPSPSPLHEPANDLNKTTPSVEVIIRPSEHTGISGTPTERVLHEKQFALVFEDGGDNLIESETLQLLDILKTANVRATFFQTGQVVRENPSLNRKISEAGHTVASHAMTHTLLNRIGLSNAFKEIDKGREEVVACTGLDNAFIRLPFDESNDDLKQYLHEKKMVVFHGGIPARDWQITDTAELYDQTLKSINQEKGGLLLLHENNATTLIILPALLEELHSRGYTSVVFVPSPS
jgi:peptidoglycan/xylan/chitin deacetylase (PgdA/CDA1 family)